jgi:hypothetical protein
MKLFREYSRSSQDEHTNSSFLPLNCAISRDLRVATLVAIESEAKRRILQHALLP